MSNTRLKKEGLALFSEIANQLEEIRFELASLEDYFNAKIDSVSDRVQSLEASRKNQEDQMEMQFEWL